MDKERLLEFIRLIVRSGASTGPLEELADILETQRETENAKLVRQTVEDYREVYAEVGENSVLTKQQLDIAHQRAEQRREWERNISCC